MAKQRTVRLAAQIFSLLVLPSFPAVLSASTYAQINLVSSVPGLAANTDPNLINPWGMSFTATSPFWISDAGSGVSTLYTGAGVPNALVVGVPGGGPTGQVANTTSGFLIGGTTTSRFIFDTLGGTIDAWASGNAVIQATTAGAVYTGLALGSSGGNNYLYAANTAGGGSINVFNSSFAPTTLAGSFIDPNLPAGYVPFNVQLIGTQLYVLYADLNANGIPVAGSTGFVDIFNTDGTFVKRLAGGGPLDGPWGITLAPPTFGIFGGDLLVGNFGNGQINAFDPVTGAFIGTLDGSNGQPIVNQDLWALDFRTGGPGVDPNALYFTAGINRQTQGLFGEIAVSPEPSSLILGGIGVASLAIARLRQRLTLKRA